MGGWQGGIDPLSVPPCPRTAIERDSLSCLRVAESRRALLWNLHLLVALLRDFRLSLAVQLVVGVPECLGGDAQSPLEGEVELLLVRGEALPGHLERGERPLLVGHRVDRREVVQDARGDLVGQRSGAHGPVRREVVSREGLLDAVAVGPRLGVATLFRCCLLTLALLAAVLEESIEVGLGGCPLARALLAVLALLLRAADLVLLL
jgi:hypothetical protein